MFCMVGRLWTKVLKVDITKLKSQRLNTQVFAIFLLTIEMIMFMYTLGKTHLSGKKKYLCTSAVRGKRFLSSLLLVLCMHVTRSMVFVRIL